jgi:NADH-quinone oxidoreductase subunit L
MYFLVFHGEERFRHKPHPSADDHGHDAHGHAHEPHESPWVVWLPLVLLALPSVVIGAMTMAPMLSGDFFKGAIAIDATRHAAMSEVVKHAGDPMGMAMHGLVTLPFWLALAGVVTAWVFYLKAPSIPAAIDRALSPLRTVLENKYYMDWFNEHVLAAGARRLGLGLWKGGDHGRHRRCLDRWLGAHRGGGGRPAASRADGPHLLVRADDDPGHLRLPHLAAVAFPERVGALRPPAIRNQERTRWVC